MVRRANLHLPGNAVEPFLVPPQPHAVLGHIALLPRRQFPTSHAAGNVTHR